MKLYLGGHLSWYAPQRVSHLEIRLEQPTALSAVVSRLRLPLGEIMLSAVNGTLVRLETAEVCDSDDVELHPPNGAG